MICVVGCFRLKKNVVHFHLKCEFKFSASEVVPFSKDSDVFFLVAKFLLLKILYVFLEVDKKKFPTKQSKLPFELSDDFASCHAAVFKLHKVLFFLLLLEKVACSCTVSPSLGRGLTKSCLHVADSA